MLTQQSMRELESDADTRKVLIRVHAAGLIRIHDGDGRRVAAHLIGKMVIGNDHVQPVIARPLERLEAADAAIDADHERISVLLSLLKCWDIDPIALSESIRHMKTGVDT